MEVGPYQRCLLELSGNPENWSMYPGQLQQIMVEAINIDFAPNQKI